MKDKSDGFGGLFNTYRLRAGFLSLGEFGQALAEEGFVYEDSIFSKWKSGERVPRERKLAIALIRVFVQMDAKFCLEDANLLLESLDYRQLNLSEIEKVFVDIEGVVNRNDYYSKYRPLNEPNVLFQNLVVTREKVRVLILGEIENEERRKYWQYQVRCAIADYYSKLSDGKKTPQEVFGTLARDYYEVNDRVKTVILTVEDPNSPEEYLALTMRCVCGEKGNDRLLEVVDLFGCEGIWPHEKAGWQAEQTGELSRFVIPNWAWVENAMLSKMGFDAITEYAKGKGIKFFYAIVSDYITDVLERAGVTWVNVVGAHPLYLQANAKGRFPIAFEDAQDYALFWQRFRPKLCYFK